MLGRLMKYEWKATWKLLVPVNLFMIVMAFFACITVRIDFFDVDNDGIIFSAVMIVLTYAASIFAALIGTTVFLIYRFYTSTYGDQGYLLHTLPVDKHYIILAKVLVSGGWVLLSAFLMNMSVIFLFNEEEDIFERFIDNMNWMAQWAGEQKVTGFAILMTLISIVVEMLARVLKVTACISLGQLSSNHKLMMAFAFYFAIYIVQQTVNALYYTVLGFINMKTNNWYYGKSWEFTLISGLVYLVVFYLITWYVMEKKLNLD